MDLAQKPVYKLDLAAGTSVANLTTPLVEGDDRAQTFTLELTDKGAPANLNGYSVTAYFGRGKTAEAEADTIPLSGTVSGNVAAITLTESCYSRSCYFSMPIRLSNGATGQKRTYLIVRGTVVKSVDGKIIDPDGSVPSLDDLFAQIAVMERSRQAAEEATDEALAAAARADKAREGIQGDLATLTEEIAGVDAQTITAVSSNVEPADQHYSFGAPVQGFSSVTGVGTFWVTDKDPSMKAIIGKTLKSITLHVVAAGNLTIRGYDGVIDGSLDSASLRNEAVKANAEGYDLFTIATSSGVSTYLLDGSDSRVTIKRESLECPNTIGLFKQGENATFYFSALEEPSKYVYFTHSAMDDSQRLKHRLGFAVSVGETSKKAGIEISAHTKAGTTHKTIINPDELKPLANGDLNNFSISILGDSISTFEGHIPNGYAHYYPMGDIQSVEQTWWKQLVNETGLVHISQAAWSGSTVTGDSTSETNAYAACSTARVNELSNNGAIIPDIVLVYIGINDFGLHNRRGIGDYNGTTEIPDEGTKTLFSEAYALMLKKIMATYPKTSVYCCTLLECTASNYDQDGNTAGFPTKNANGVALAEYNAAITTIAEAVGARVIDLHSCGIHHWNTGVYTIDGIHPNAAGAVLIKDCIKRRLLADFGE